MRPHLISFLLAALVLTPPAICAQTQSQIASVSETPPGPRDHEITSTVPYAGTAADPLTLDVYRLHGPGPHPAVIIIHGGGFLHGTSHNGSEAYAADFLAPAGYAVFSINYRLGSKSGVGGATFSDMLADVQRAIRFVRHNASKYEVDPGKIAILGGSAGGYLSNLAGVTRPSAQPTAADPIDRETDAIQAVITLYGIADLATMPNPEFVGELHLLGPATPTPAAITAASPVSLVRADDPPFLLIHGAKDPSVPIAQSVRFQAALQAAGNKATLITIPAGVHGTGSWHSSPGVPDWERQTVEWLNSTLHHTGPVGEGIVPRDGPSTSACTQASGHESISGPVPESSLDRPAGLTIHGCVPKVPPAFKVTLSLPVTYVSADGGRPIEAHVSITNLSTKELANYPGYANFRVTVKRAGTEIERTRLHHELRADGQVEDTLSGSQFTDFIEPGGSQVSVIDLRKLYRIAAAGEYSVVVERYDSQSDVFVRSDTARLEVR